MFFEQVVSVNRFRQFHHFSTVNVSRYRSRLALESNKVSAAPVDRLVRRPIFHEFGPVDDQRTRSVLRPNEVRVVDETCITFCFHLFFSTYNKGKEKKEKKRKVLVLKEITIATAMRTSVKTWNKQVNRSSFCFAVVLLSSKRELAKRKVQIRCD